MGTFLIILGSIITGIYIGIEIIIRMIDHKWPFND